ncbi:biotin--[acetyl-CoA-carboxylase] ligase [Elizabethkingia sp. JS20170427COW]|uniref:biotin--[acetyl-CoA-carboxylase] ligase n=1 Tax=Elizabethkingia sp. JS20170427COW TaxID=2583851 RepID=UPI001110B020|nr:biotin--[acetyl-CoA-carboxylase] ligase [Elizabethkingia sp. JS20170427COW]QCX53021.1 biotin--[acetyl-CoA-carboxylase] ligase [Elizabethkingia sp. JS20170427COW]
MNSLLYLPIVGSTNDEISNFVEEELSAPFAVYTFNQTKGRGQYGNVWESIENKNLAYSLLIPCSSIRISATHFNFHTALVVRDFLANITDIQAEVKWPNDIILNGKKVVGILLEKKKIHHHDYYIIGIGVNILQENFEEISKAGSLKTQTNKDFDLQEFAKSFHSYLVKHLLEDKKEIKILQEYNNHLFRRFKVSVFEKNTLRQNGIIQSVDNEGYLHVELEQDGNQKFYYKEIKLLY